MISAYHAPAHLNTDITDADDKGLKVDDRGIGGSRDCRSIDRQHGHA